MTYYFLCDTETGGLDETKVSLLTVFGYVLDENLNVVDKIDLAIKPNSGLYFLQAAALEINKINIAEHDKVAITETNAANALLIFLNKYKKLVFAGHNPDFDKRFLKVLFKNRTGSPYISSLTWEDLFSSKTLDTAANAQLMKLTGHLPKSNDGSLAQLCQYYKIAQPASHTSQGDVESTLTVLKAMITTVKPKTNKKLTDENIQNLIEIPEAIVPTVQPPSSSLPLPSPSASILSFSINSNITTVLSSSVKAKTKKVKTVKTKKVL